MSSFFASFLMLIFHSSFLPFLQPFPSLCTVILFFFCSLLGTEHVMKRKKRIVTSQKLSSAVTTTACSLYRVSNCLAVNYSVADKP